MLPWRAALVNLGTAFWVHDYFRYVRNAKVERQIRYIPLVYDLIPIVRPEFCVPGWIRDVSIWLVGAFQHADAFLAISRSAKQDLLAAAARMGHVLAEEAVEVVPLDADFRRAGNALSLVELDRWQLGGVDFALLVSTIEPRKNHALAFDVWADLLRRHGPDRVPRLVCAGRDGWMNDAVFDRLDTDPVLATHVTLIHRISDAELDLLYRACRFTIFPSLYEGWGLPVTEALCHGRVPIIADNSSLPEAGAGLAAHFVSGSAADLAAAVEQVGFDHPWRKAQEAKIAAEFAPRSWAEIAEQIESAPDRLLALGRQETHPQAAEPGLYYPVALYDAREIGPGVGSGEIFRLGEGWLWPDVDGCRTKPEGGLIRLRIAGDGPWRIYIGVRGLHTVDCPTTVSLDGVMLGRMIARHGKCGWLACDLPEEGAPEFDLLVRGDSAEVMPSLRGGHHIASVAVAGFFICARDDVAANTGFIEARRIDLAVIDAYRQGSPLEAVRAQRAHGVR
jgi:glycosyltransferase involved in cell wall biosynthesis